MRAASGRSRSVWVVVLATAAVVWLLARLIADGASRDGTSAPAASASAPASGSGSASPTASPAVPSLWPRPEKVTPRAGSVPITATVRLLADASTDRPTLDTVTRALTSAGQVRVEQGGEAAAGDLLVSVSSDGSRGALTGLGVPGPAGLPSGGYVLATGRAGGRPQAVLAGADPLGAFYAAQTLAQLIRPVGAATAARVLPVVTVRDRPATAVRGVVEGFYGTPWSEQQRFEQLDFEARFKLDSYLYTPKADPYLRDRWRDPYPPARLTGLARLTARARADHVTFVYALSPGTSVCYSSARDVTALEAKFQQLWDLGVRDFAVPLDDIEIGHWNCPADTARYGSGHGAVGRAQADLLNRLQRDFTATHQGAAPLLTVPTEYDQLRSSAYKSALADRLDPAVTVAWTGPLVVSPTVTGAQVRSARSLYRHPVLVWDNFPVNDYVPGHLLLGPYEGRSADLPAAAAGLLVNPMNQAAASDPAIFSAAAYSWNPAGFRPAAALDAGLAALAGGDPGKLAALRAFADVNHDSRINGTEAPGLAGLIAAYRHGRAGAAQALRARLDLLAGAPAALGAVLPGAGPWLSAAAEAARACLAALSPGSPRVRVTRRTVHDFRGRAVPLHISDHVLLPLAASP